MSKDRTQICLPLDGPLHGTVCDDEWGDDVKNLCAETSPCVEECGVEGSGKWALGVCAQAVVDDTSLLWRTWKRELVSLEFCGILLCRCVSAG
jgi:hypothetical protein